MRYDDDFSYWLTGLIDASGIFSIHPLSCRFRLSMFTENKAVLTDICERMGVGGVYLVPVYSTTRPRHVWELQSRSDCASLSRFLDQYPLRTTKQTTYMVWRRAVAFWNSSEGTKEERREAMLYLRRLLTE